MNVPMIQPGDSMKQASIIFDLCPNLRNLSLHEYNYDYSEQVMFVIMYHIPKDNLQSCSLDSYCERSDANSLATPLEQHFDSLRSVRLIECAWIRPEQVQTILLNCPVLEVFVITEAKDHVLDISVGPCRGNVGVYKAGRTCAGGQYRYTRESTVPEAEPLYRGGKGVGVTVWKAVTSTWLAYCPEGSPFECAGER